MGIATSPKTKPHYIYNTLSEHSKLKVHARITRTSCPYRLSFEVYKTVHNALEPFVRINYERFFDACNSNTNQSGQLAISAPFLLLNYYLI